MDSHTAVQKSIDTLLKLSATKGYITYDDILEVTDSFMLSMAKMTKVSEHLISCGCIVRENDNHYIDQDSDDELIVTDRSKLDYEQIFQNACTFDPGLATYIDAIRMIPPPQYREADNLIIPAQHGNAYAKERIILMYLKVVIKIAIWGSNKYKLPLADTIQLGNIGLILAVDKYEPSAHNKFSTYAPWWIRQVISREAAVPNTNLYFPAHMKEKLYSATDIIDKYIFEPYERNENNDNLVHEIATALDVEEHTAAQYIRYLQPMLSIEEELDDDNGCIFSDDNLQIDESAIQVDRKLFVNIANDVLDTITPRERKVLELRYGFTSDDNMTLEQVGQIMGVTRERIRQIEAKALKKLGHPTRSRLLRPFYI
ncbi:RNA polymerase sigma factor RpoD/SigA [Desulfosporosinus sp. BICA1-9]|uniref:sigma-70 family RNA polymerase sigma factor n=1 Tax=Desulfosporosinus sp. BICA1-9 TaxID=1531958 RepID=UPI00054B4EDE|nr:RNA polymerase sigma factor RpoD/SigA [Desulfosporosinus sp. BICA1-9]KJS45984.1 MAG: hypothetical protein VR66_27820 [Peptococcaceae bacterium BRH_c23]KJS87300.1 MAG: hypothetical protein JL57_14465 [Desulfosporosinus sp. BICA1-9]